MKRERERERLSDFERKGESGSVARGVLFEKKLK